MIGNDNQWVCGRCGLGNFRDFNDAQQHETVCEQYSRKRTRPGSPKNLPYDHSNHDHRASSQKSQLISTEKRFKPCIFMPISEQPPNNISQLDIITCQHVEVFKASAADVADNEGAGVMSVHKGQVGFRCIHCTKNPFVKAEYSSVFPGSLGSVAASLQLMTKVHFEKCMNLDQGTSDELKAVRKSFRCNPDDEEWFKEAFVEYALDSCKRLNIGNRSPPQTGLVLVNEPNNPPTNTYAFKGSIETGRSNEAAQPSNPLRNNSNIGGSPSIGITPTRSGSPPSLYDSPNSQDYPFMQNQQGFWECRHCWGFPYNQKAQGSCWNSLHPPNREFIEYHLNSCQGAQSENQQQHACSTNAIHQPNQYDNMSHTWNNIPQMNSFGVSQMSPAVATTNMHTTPHGNFHMSPQQQHRPPTHPSRHMNNSNGGMNSQEAYAFHQQQMSLMNNMQMYQHKNDYNQGYGTYQQVGFNGQSMEYNNMMYPHRSPVHEEKEDVALETTISYLEKELKDIESRPSKNAEDNEKVLVQDEDKELLTDYFFYVMKQLRFCRFTENDRKTRGGKRENIKIEFGGLKCVHCSESQNPRKFFWSNVDRLANSFAEIPGHVLKCRRCPSQTKQALQALKLRHSVQMKQLPRGSQKVFFRRMWRKLHEEDKPTSLIFTDGNTEPNQDNSDAPFGAVITALSTDAAAKALAAYAEGKKTSTRILLAIDEDKSWLSDMDCFVRNSLELFCATAYDVESAKSESKYPITEGQVGIRCIHCAVAKKSTSGKAVNYPPFVSGIYESVREFHIMHLPSCPCIPEASKQKLASLKGSSSLSSVLRKYYKEAAEALGIYDTDEGMRAGGDVKPIGKKDNDLAGSIHRLEESNHSYLNSMDTGHETKKRKLEIM
jgi:hypothetical protein